MKSNLFIIILLVLTLQNNAQTITDVDNNTYNTVTIGTQIWMKENLKTTKYNDGTAIPNVTDSSVWGPLTTPAYCWFNNDVTYKNIYGALYNWYTVNTAKLCPSGWHVPTDADWTVLSTYLGGGNVAGSKLKEAGNTHWTFPNTDATNSSGFTGLPGGYCKLYTHGRFFNYPTITGMWWTSTIYDSQNVYRRTLFDEPSIFRDFGEKNYGLYVRCLNNLNTSVHKLSVSDDKIIYPNPAIDKLYIKKIKSLNSLVMIYDLQGKEVLSMQIDSNSIDISNLSKGIYLVKIIDSENTIVNKLIKE